MLGLLSLLRATEGGPWWKAVRRQSRALVLCHLLARSCKGLPTFSGDPKSQHRSGKVPPGSTPSTRCRSSSTPFRDKTKQNTCPALHGTHRLHSIFPGRLLHTCAYYSCYIRVRKQRGEEGNGKLSIYCVIFTHFLDIKFCSLKIMNK